MAPQSNEDRYVWNSSYALRQPGRPLPMSRQPSEHDPFPGAAVGSSDEELRDVRRACRDSGDPEPPIYGPYNGWEN